MTSSELIQKLLKEVRDLRQKGVSTIDAAKLEEALSSGTLIDNKKHEWGFRLFDATIRYGDQAIKSAVLINGGAAVGVLTFLGHVSSQLIQQECATSLLFFIIGVLFATVTYGISYLAQRAYQRAQFEQKANIHADILSWMAIGFMCISYLLFLFGSLRACEAFTKTL
jgi:hypothetical protein